MGELHLEVILDRLSHEFKVPVVSGKPQVAYRETLLGTAKHEARHVKQSGGHGQYAHVHMLVEPGEAGHGLQFENRITGGAIPREYIPAVKRGIIEAMTEGPYAGFPMVDVKVTIYDGSAHDVDSSEQAFRTCARKGFQEACLKAGMELLEPVMTVEVTVPPDQTGTVTNTLFSRRGQIAGMEQRSNAALLRAKVPLDQMFGYASELRTATSGMGEFTMHFDRYRAMPYALAEEVVALRRAEGKIRAR